jgi:hypothetical protein
MIHTVAPPILLRDGIEDPAEVVAVLERNAPYAPLVGWYPYFQKAGIADDLKECFTPDSLQAPSESSRPWP